jgi:SET family sugar efflux transporter-like MFS transporter
MAFHWNDPGHRRADYYLAGFLAPTCSALLYPVLTLFYTQELSLAPWVVSLFSMLLPVATFVVVQGVGVASDRGASRPALIAISLLCGAGASLLLGSYPPVWALFTLGLALFAAMGIAFPQTFASGHEYAVRYLSDGMMFTTQLRSIASFAWVGAPPVSFFIATALGFRTLYALCAAFFAASALYIFIRLPRVPMIASKDEQAADSGWWRRRKVVLLCLAVMLLFTAFSGYISCMPLFIMRELNLPSWAAGAMYGLSAFLEIPLMFLGARLSGRTGLARQLMAGGAALAIFLCAMPFFSAPWMFLASSLLPALFIANCSNMGMILFQRLLPSIPGQATSLFLNCTTLGQIFAGALFSLSGLGSYRYVFAACLLCCLLGLFCLWAARVTREDEAPRPLRGA